MITHLTTFRALIFSSTTLSKQSISCPWQERKWGTEAHQKFLVERRTEPHCLPTHSSLGHPSPSPKAPSAPIRPVIQGHWFLYMRFGQALHFYPIYIFILQGQAVLWTSQQNWRAYFYSRLFSAFPLVCTCSYVNERRLQNVFCLGQWNSWGQPCHSFSLTLFLPYLCLGFSFCFCLCCLGYMGRFLICC